MLLAFQGAVGGTTVTGRVTDDSGNGLATAHGQCGERPNPASRRVFADSQGRLSIRVPSAATHVYCAIGAPGYVTLRRTVPIAGGRGAATTRDAFEAAEKLAPLGELDLPRAPSDGPGIED